MTTTYLDYTRDAGHMALYSAYQARYVQEPRESDTVILGLVAEILRDLPAARRPGRLLDIGCSTANLLRHLRRACPGLELAGFDLAADVIGQCQRDPDLAGIRFEVMDMLELPASGEFDIVTADAALMFFTDAQFARALARIGGALRPGGALVAFDFFHPYPQGLAIRETSDLHPRGLELHFRPFQLVRAALAAAGFGEIDLRPFTMPVDLVPSAELPLSSRTVRTAGGGRLCFRGALFQPWCHLRAVKVPP